MNLKERIVKALFGDVIRDEVEKSSKQIVSHVPGISLSEGILPDVDFEIFNQMHEQTSWVRAVVGVICKAVTARGYGLVPAKPDADPKNAELLQEFFGNCNPNDTLLEILDDVTRDVYVFGNSFLEVVIGPNGKPRELWNLDATTMRVKADEHGGIMGYVQIPRFATTRSQTGKVEFEPREVIHFKLGTKGATLYGLSPLASLVLPITVDKFAQVYNRAFFVNGAKIRGAFIMKDATSEQVERNRDYMKERAKNLDTAHSDLVLEGDIEFKQIGVNQKDMEFLELREFTRNEILAVYGVPPGKVSIIETGNIGAGSGEHQTQTFYEETILPFQMRVAEKINKHVIRQGFGISDWSFQFNKRAIDEKDQAEIFNVYLQNGVFTPEEVRRVVAPRMPELQKSLPLSKAIVAASREAVEIEERFARALERIFREIKAAVAAGLPALGGQAAKQLDDLEVLLALIDKDKIARIVQGFTLEAARKGLALSARRNGLKDVDEPSLALQEKIRSNALSVAANVSESLKAGLRQALIDGVAANETIPQLMRRVEEQLDAAATIPVKPVLDAEGNVLRAGGTRRLDRATASEIIARTEANRAYNEGNLDALRQAGVERAQWLLASDACPICVELAETTPGDKLGRIMSLDEASGVIPAHPNCFPGHVPVFTPEGWKPISQIQAGDKVLTDRLRFRRVAQTFSHDYGGPMTRLAYHRSDWRGDVACTPNHRFLTPQGDWKEARELKLGDSLLLLANRCGACGEPVPYWRGFCSKRCVALSEWQRPGHKEVVSEKARTQMLREYAHGTRDGQAIVRKAHEAVRHLVALGMFSRQLKPLCGEDNPSKRPDVREKIRQSKLGANNPMFGRYGPLNPHWRGGKVRYRGKDWTKTCRMVKERDGFRCAGCGITEEESTHSIGTPLQVHHLIPFRVKPANDAEWLTTLCARCHARTERVIDRLLYNDMHEYQTMEICLTDIETFQPKRPIMVHNLEVEGDESYIARGFIAHNCRCTWVSVLEDR